MPSLMHLPQELHLQIFKDLELLPTAMLLRLTSKYFYNLIRPLSDIEMARLEDDTYCRDHKLGCCVHCHRLRPNQNFVPRGILIITISDQKNICIDCGIGKGDYFKPRGTILMWDSKTQVMCDDCSDLPKGSLHRLGDVCQGCWKGLDKSHRAFATLGKGNHGLSEEEVLIRQAKKIQGTERFYHRTCCVWCRRWFRECGALLEAAKRGEHGGTDRMGTRLESILCARDH